MKNILLIEDNFDHQNNIVELLELFNFKVIVAKNGKIGVEIAHEYIPDLIICDISMPILDGYGVLDILRKNDTMKKIPFIFLTSKAEQKDLEKAMELGANEYLIKPFGCDELLNAIERQLKKADLQLL